MSVLSNLIQKLGDWIKHIWSGSETLYDTLSDNEKKAATYAYGIIALINKYGDVALPFIQKEYPEVTENVLQGFLASLLQKVHAIDDNVPLTLMDAIKAVYVYLSKFEGETWKQYAQGAGNILMILFSPETPIQKAINIAEYFYQLFVKPKIATLAVQVDTPFQKCVKANLGKCGSCSEDGDFTPCGK